MQVIDRRVAESAELAVDATNRQFNLIAQVHIGLDTLTTRARNLNESNISNLDRTVTQQLAIRLQPVTDALRIVKAINPEHHCFRVSQSLANVASTLLNRGIPGELFKASRVNRNRERLRNNASRRLPLDRDFDSRVFGGVVREPAHRGRKV